MSKFVLFVWVLAYGNNGGVSTTTIEFEDAELCRAAAAEINKQEARPRALCIRRRAAF